MLEDLFKNNKLEYIFIKTYKFINIVNSMTLSSNIENLRYFNVIYYNGKVDITLNISKVYPKKLQFCKGIC